MPGYSLGNGPVHFVTDRTQDVQPRRLGDGKHPGAAYEGDQSSLAANRETYRTRQHAALALINAIDGLSCLPPAGVFYLYVNCGGVIGKRKQDGTALESDGDVVLYLLENAEVALVAGAAYGLSPYFRISIATDLDTIETGIARIARALSQLT
ncbi:MAG: aminotransferase class I/II-fold pyridoxal phosphate-dependent enzyme [Sodalis sp. (in: enterobacteria)]|uniref:aminotransferase class I/II-fold pyridoxal phosphate-dependent enzyme n=1 Tax=Sodalis sp. (in: enterobacteria) TaxID=1898979 RepID=UPI0039E4D386